MLFTRHPAVEVADKRDEEAKAAHRSPSSTQHADRWKPVWTYMLTE